MGRRLLADPDLPAKLATGRRDEVRPCIYQYRCIGNIFLNSHVACVARPETAREEDLEVGPTETPERILVVGGGPAGLDAAWRLAARGHEVVLREASTHLGGRLTVAARGDEHLDRMLGWLLGQVARHEVELHLGQSATPADAVGFDRVVLATGGGWGRPAVRGADLPHVRGLDDLSTWDDELDGPVVVLGGGKAGLTLARSARSLGHAVTVVEPSAVLAVELGLPGRFRWIADLEAAGVRLLTRHATVGITPAEVAVTGPDGEGETIPASTVLVAAAGPVDDALAEAFRATGVPTEVVGDARAAERLEGAFRDAAELAVRT
jgi:NADPH-dependent 2,4-dienoyl-CoA reductase/sulfur reductase-like enzyme